MSANRPSFVGSLSSGVDGSSEGGRLSTSRLSSALVLYAVPLANHVKQSGYAGRLTAEPVLKDGTWCLKLVYEGDRPKAVPERWHGHRVILEKAKPSE